MTIITWIGWALGSSLIIGGVIGWLLYTISRPLINAEIEGMKRGGKFEGEPDYMQDSRVARAEWDLDANLRYTRLAKISLFAGIAIFTVLIIF